MIDGPPERGARVLGSRHKNCAVSGRSRVAEIRTPVSVMSLASASVVKLRNNLAMRSLVTTSPSPFRNILPAGGRLHTVPLHFF